MSKVWFTSDTHFNDKSIMPHEIEVIPNKQITRSELDQHIINCWNTVVNPEDTVYHLGDFGKYTNIDQVADVVKKLNGHKILVCGNHDLELVQEQTGCKDADIETEVYQYWTLCGFEQVYTRRTFLSEYTVVSHKPPEFINEPYLWLFGHVHVNQLYRTVTPISVCVCADRWNWFPVEYDTILNAVKMARTIMETQGYNFFTEDVNTEVLNGFMGYYNARMDKLVPKED